MSDRITVQGGIDMGEPKTIQQFLALPERATIGSEKRMINGRLFDVPAISPQVVFWTEPDTVLLAADAHGLWRLSRDEIGWFRERV